MIKIKKTEDGSHTVFVPELNEHYHSSFGAIRESMHVFVKAGLSCFNDAEEINILEMGFGTGLNALLTALNRRGQTISYHGIEAFPLEKDVLVSLNYPELLSDPLAGYVYNELHQAKWEEPTPVSEGFTVEKTQSLFQEIQLPDKYYHLVYFDAFAPDIQPELWAEEIFAKIFHAMKPGGILVTYSAKGLVKQNLRQAGFTVKRLPGPPGKKHMIRAEKR